MDDLISRQAAIDALEEPPKVPDTWSDESAIGEREQWEKDVKALNSLPPAQPEIIQCRDCVYGEQDDIGRWFCRSLGCQVGDEDGSGFCADGERRSTCD